MQPIKFNIEITEYNLNLVGQALGKLPYETVADLINDLRVQAARQSKEAQDATKESTPKDKIPDEKTGRNEAPIERSEDALPAERPKVGK